MNFFRTNLLNPPNELVIRSNEIKNRSDELKKRFVNVYRWLHVAIVSASHINTTVAMVYSYTKYWRIVLSPTRPKNPVLQESDHGGVELASEPGEAVFRPHTSIYLRHPSFALMCKINGISLQL